MLERRGTLLIEMQIEGIARNTLGLHPDSWHMAQILRRVMATRISIEWQSLAGDDTPRLSRTAMEIASSAQSIRSIMCRHEVNDDEWVPMAISLPQPLWNRRPWLLGFGQSNRLKAFKSLGIERRNWCLDNLWAGAVEYAGIKIVDKRLQAPCPESVAQHFCKASR